MAIDELVVTRSQLLHLPNYHYPAITVTEAGAVDLEFEIRMAWLACSRLGVIDKTGQRHDAYIATNWPTEFKLKSEVASARAKYPKIVIGDQLIAFSPLTEVGNAFGKIDPYPASCGSAIERYFREAFEKALLIIDLDGPQNETVTVELKELRPELHNGMWAVPFVAAATPKFSAPPLPMFLQAFAGKWPPAFQ